MPKNTRKNRLASRELFISCVVPLHNEAENIEAFVQALSAKLTEHTDHAEIILVDDGSRDDTAAIVVSKLLSDQVKFIRFSRNFGKEKALTAGLNRASGEVCILIDADFQHPVETIDNFLASWSEGYDMVYGVRDNRNAETWLKRSFTRMFYWFMKNMGEISVPANAGDYRLLDKTVVDALNRCCERSRFMKGLYAWVGFKSIEVVYPVAERRAGDSSWNFFRLTELALTGIFSFSDIPLRVWSLVGLFVSALSFLAALYIIIDTLLFGETVPGYATLLTVVVFFGGVQMLSIGILGEYISRVFQEVKRRPQYIVAEKYGFDVEEA